MLKCVTVTLILYKSTHSTPVRDLNNVQADNRFEVKTILLTEFDKLPSFIKNTSVCCTDHDHKCELYCSHRQLCCTVCLKESHVHCEKLETIQDVVKNVKTSPLLEDIENDLKFIMTNLESLIKNRQENKTRINAQKLACMEEIQNVRKLIIDRLDEMEKSLKDTMASNVEQLGLDFDNLSQELNVHKSYISALQKELEAALIIATDLQVFLGLRPLEVRVEEEFSYLETLKTNKAMDEVNLKLDISSIMRAISEGSESFGKGQAQLLLPSVNDKSNITFSEKAQFQLPIGENDIKILGCTVLPGGLLIFTDSKNNRLLICDGDGTFERDICLSFTPRDITYINNSTIGVTCKSSKKVVLIELITGKELSSFSTSDNCYGLSFLNELLTLRITGSFITTTLTGKIKSTLEEADCSTYCCASEDCIISSNRTNHSVLCYKTNGDPAWQFQDQKLQTPRDVTVDENGCVLVVGAKSNNVFVISSDGQRGREILNDLDKPYTVHFDKTSKLMVVANRSGSAKVFTKT
ncbi:unnamed protein product [Mytilus coruscus]|uniref:B box-type domain-containing protein n=1 Tax=Mytilus coruscus TaxID=42192 RepID=A0A6J8DVU2_MYTCO|nr:unnamed protein product [Mytilus coruscus]